MILPRSVLAAVSIFGFALLASAAEFESIFDGRSLAGWETPDLNWPFENPTCHRGTKRIEDDYDNSRGLDTEP